MTKIKENKSSRSQKAQDPPSKPLHESEPHDRHSPNKQENSPKKNRGEKGEKEEKSDSGCLEKKQASRDPSNEKISLGGKKDKNYTTWIILIVIGGILIAFISIILHKLQSTKQLSQIVNSSSNPQIHPTENFKKEFKDLKSKFIAQDADFWKRIKVPVLRVIRDEEPEYPAIVLLVVPKGGSTSKTATCLAKQYRSIINKVYTGEEKLEKGYINVQTISRSSVEDFKYVLDREIKELFNSTKPEVHTVVIDHIEALDPNVMLLFHGYCDGDHAPYKKAMFVFVLHTDLETEIASEDLDKTVDHHLLTLWEKNLDKDKIPPLIARVANNKALIQEEHISSLTMSGC